MGRVNRVPPVHFGPGQVRALLLVIGICAVAVVLALTLGMLFDRAMLLILALTGRRPPRRTWMSDRLARLEEEQRLRKP